MERLPLRLAGPAPLLVGLALASCACQPVYYDVMERFGVQKRHILVDRVEEGREDQEEAREQFQTTLQRFKEATGFEGGDLEDLYDDLSREYERSEARAEDVRARIRSIEDVASDLFSEWEDEIGEISSADLRRRSAEQLRRTRERYGRMIAAMKRAEQRMGPVLVAFRDQVLFLKHNLNARAIASLEGNVVQIEADVERLVAEMEAAIREANAFVDAMESA